LLNNRMVNGSQPVWPQIVRVTQESLGEPRQEFVTWALSHGFDVTYVGRSTADFFGELSLRQPHCLATALQAGVEQPQLCAKLEAL
jgi:hypothetical protein